MRSMTAGWIRLLLVAISLSATNGYADGDTAAEPRFPVEELLAACEEARTSFRPLTAADLEEARTELTDAVGRLDKKLQSDAQNGPNWREYLQWDRMQEQLLPEATPDLGALLAINKKYRAAHRGLKLAWFADVRCAIERYRLVARAVDSSKTRARFERILAGLPDYIEAYQTAPTVELALSIGNALKWLEDRRQVPELVARLRRELGHPNMLFQISDDMLKALLAGPAEDKSPVRDVILGTSLYGTGHTTGQVEARLIADDHCGVFESIFSGVAKTETVGYNGPVRLFSTGSTEITGRIRVRVGTDGLSAEPTISEGKTRYRIHDIKAKRDSQIIERAAWRRSSKQECKAAWIAARHAEQRLNERLDQDAATMIGRINGAYNKKVRQPLMLRNLFPGRVDFRTTEKLLQVVGLQADSSQLGAPNDPPELPANCDFGVRIHESMINNLAAAGLGGTLITEEGVLAVLQRQRASQELLDRVRSMEGEPAWKIAFDRVRPAAKGGNLPIAVTFAGGGFAVTVRGSQFYRGTTGYPAAELTARYLFEKTERGFRAVRQGGLEVTRPDGGFAMNRAVFQRRFEGSLPEEFVVEPFEVTVGGKDGSTRKRTIRMEPVQCDCRQGWLVIGWENVPK